MNQDESVLAKTRLSKSVAIQAGDFEGTKVHQTENYASPVTAPTTIGITNVSLLSMLLIFKSKG